MMKAFFKSIAVSISMILVGFWVDTISLETLAGKIWLHAGLVFLYIPLVVTVEPGTETSTYQHSFLIFWKRTYSTQFDYIQVKFMHLIPLSRRMSIYSGSSFVQPKLSKVVTDILDVAMTLIPVGGSLSATFKTSLLLRKL